MCNGRLYPLYAGDRCEVHSALLNAFGPTHGSDDVCQIISVKPYYLQLHITARRTSKAFKATECGPKKFETFTTRAVRREHRREPAEGSVPPRRRSRPESKSAPIPKIVGVVVITGKANLSKIAATERSGVFEIDDFLKTLGSEKARRAAFGNVGPQIVADPLTDPTWKDRLF